MIRKTDAAPFGAIDRRTLLAAAAGAGVIAAAPPIEDNAGTETIRLWPGDPPGLPVELPEASLKKEGGGGRREFRLRGVAAPVLSVYRAAEPNGAAIVAIPGGGFAYVSVQNEGTAVARRLTAMGYTVLVLSYRLPAEGWTNRTDAPVQDAIRAMRVARAQAGALRVAPDRVGVLGFSAGGHLAASLATGWDEPLYEAVDAADRASPKPAFVGLAYPVTTLQPPCAEIASRRNLLGPDPDAALVAKRSPVTRIGKETAPCFLVHALDDPIVNPACSIAWVAACHGAGVLIEAHLLEKGGHGFGVGLPAANPGAAWPDQFRLWAARHGG
ncbi:alpha/beta hydrolase [Sphingomonas sp.]|uniref:alpha/beta hydrolase n=1 Tax=Sphingomonas sp. TaxID=28214 RepID=UPI003AFFAFE5